MGLHTELLYAIIPTLFPCFWCFPGWSLFYGTERNGTERFRHIIPRNGTIDACTLRSNQTIQTELKSMYISCLDLTTGE